MSAVEVRVPGDMGQELVAAVVTGAGGLSVRFSIRWAEDDPDEVAAEIVVPAADLGLLAALLTAAVSMTAGSPEAVSR